MKKNAKQYLMQWKKMSNRKPLLVTGNLSYIKTKLLKDFGREQYKRVLYLDLETQPEWATIFDPQLSPERIIEVLGFLENDSIDTKNTLIILDGIQDFPEILTCLQHFALAIDDYHMIATYNREGKDEVSLQAEQSRLIQSLHLEANPLAAAVAS